MLQLESLSFDYADHCLFNHIGFNVPAGKLLHLQGHNGSGKTTLLKLIAGLLSPSEGAILLDGKPMHSLQKHSQNAICYIGHKLGLSPVLSLRQNCYFDCHYRPIDWASTISRLSLSGLDDVPCGQLSAGQRRRVVLFRLLMSKAKVWLLDEPFITFDTQTIDFLNEHMHYHLENGGLIVLTSHQAFHWHYGDYLEYCL